MGLLSCSFIGHLFITNVFFTSSNLIRWVRVRGTIIWNPQNKGQALEGFNEPGRSENE